MNISRGIGHEPSLQRLVIASILLHFILMAFLFIPFKKESEFKTYYVSLVEPAKMSRVGERAQKKVEEKPVLKKEKPAKEKTNVKKQAVPKKKDQMVLKEEKTKKSDEKKADKELEDALAIIRAKTNVKKNIAKKDEKRKIDIDKSETLVKGLSEVQSKWEEAVLDPYYGQIAEKIQEEWSTYPTFNSEQLEVEILILIDGKGKVVPNIEKSSGNAIFDQAALKAIIKASPLPPPPPLVDKEIVVRLRG